MHRTIVAALTLAWVVATPIEFRARVAPDAAERLALAPAGIDGIVIRGRIRARIAVGTPFLHIADADAGDVVISRHATTLTFERVDRPGDTRIPTVVARVARLRGVATSGDVEVTVDDRSDRPLFLDLAGTGNARVRGAVPLARTTTSGTVTANFSDLRARAIRVHARGRSRALFGTYHRISIVAVDDAVVEYRGSVPDRVTRRNRATVRRARVGATL